jgi:glycosyltransferase involved in cell wall biosynthesis
MNNHLVSVIVPCYCQAEYLDECLQSVIEQTYINWECIIINDGSPDHTEEVAKKWVEKDPRFVYLYKENGGLSSARNVGLDIARGDYIQFLDSDDRLDAEKISKSLYQINNHSVHNIVVTNFKMFREDVLDELTSYCELSQNNLLYNEILYGWDFKFNVPIHCALFSSSLFHNFRFPQDLKAKEDWIMWLTFFQQEISAIYINEILVYYRFHNKSMTKDFKHMLENTLKALAYLDQVIPEQDYKSYLLYSIERRINDCENLSQKIVRLSDRVVDSNTSIGFRIEKKIRIFFRMF